MSAEKIVPHYGIHWSDQRVAFLMQGRGGTNAIGLRERPPFNVRLPGGARHCNHQIPLANPVPNDYHWDYFIELLDDPLVRAMLPTPKVDGGVYFLEDENDSLVSLLVYLSKLSSPIYNVVIPVWTLTVDAIIKELQMTNVQPMVITQLEAKHSDVLAQVAKAAVYAPRKVLFSGKGDVVVPPAVKRITTQLNSGKYDVNDLAMLPWESLGATVIRKYMRGEWNTNPRGSDDNKLKAKSERGSYRSPGLPDRGPGVLHRK